MKPKHHLSLLTSHNWIKCFIFFDRPVSDCISPKSSGVIFQPCCHFHCVTAGLYIPLYIYCKIRSSSSFDELKNTFLRMYCEQHLYFVQQFVILKRHFPSLLHNSGPHMVGFIWPASHLFLNHERFLFLRSFTGHYGNGWPSSMPVVDRLLAALHVVLWSDTLNIRGLQLLAHGLEVASHVWPDNQAIKISFFTEVCWPSRILVYQIFWV